ncbi:MAG: flavin-nucleotide-binding protein [Polyangiaceae bacterium]|nr:flavin-nucleotide-binding protein [Polyangiaceae bacterium]
MQERAGVRELIEPIGQRILRDHMPDQHRAFFEMLPTLFIGLLDDERRPWASVIGGEAGFVTSPGPKTLAVAGLPALGDPARALVAAGAPIGILGIQPATRRRNRANGTIRRADETGFVVSVDQSFGNCPKYIQARSPEAAIVGATAVTTWAEGARLGEPACEIIRAADTFFIASASRLAMAGDPVEGVDVSHRGGKPGFVRVQHDADGTELSWPDFTGNSLYNTLGNLSTHPKAGLLFVDFSSGTLLTITCDQAVIDWDSAEVGRFEGAERLVRVRVVGGARIENGLPLRWSAPQQARELGKTGSW